MGRAFSVYNRQGLLREIQTVKLDLLVIGGGITGAGILLDATVRGLSCALIDMQDFAAGASSRSTKLVHGELRYLKQFKLGSVADIGRERAVIYENGPHVTRPEWMMLPIYKDGKRGKLSTSLAIRLYDFLLCVKKDGRRKMLNPEHTLSREPLLGSDGLLGSGCYIEYRTDDARLVIEVIKEAFEQGALALNYVKAESLLYDSDRVIGVEARDMLAGTKMNIFSKVIINATGPFADQIQEMDGKKKGKTPHLTKGIHIVIDRGRFPLQNPVYFDNPDGRMIFAIPRDGKTYIGTTETNFYDDLFHPRMKGEDWRYLLDAVKFMFPSVSLGIHDIESGWAGIRPLFLKKGKALSEISHPGEAIVSKNGLITIVGGRLTGYRKTGEKVVDLVCKRMSGGTGRYSICLTDKIPVSGGKFGGSVYYPLFIEKSTREGISLGLTQEAAKKLVTRYGSNIDILYGYVRMRSDDMKSSGLPEDLFLSLTYAMECELACTPVDYFARRTSSLFFDIEQVQKWKEPVVNYMAKKLNWTNAMTLDFMQDLELRIMDATEPG